MLAVGEEREIGIKAIGRPVQIPNDDRAHLMYYLSCVLACMPEMRSVFAEHNLDFLSNYNNYNLGAADVHALLVFCVALNPLENGVPIYPVPNGHPLLNGMSGEFYEVTDTRKLTALLAGNNRQFTGVAIVQGREVKISKFLLASETWFHTNYIGPLERLAKAQNRAAQRAPARQQEGEEKPVTCCQILCCLLFCPITCPLACLCFLFGGKKRE